MPNFQFLWLPEYEEHVAAHGATVEEFERIVQDSEWTETSRSSGLPVAFGEIFCVLESRLVRSGDVKPCAAGDRQPPHWRRADQDETGSLPESIPRSLRSSGPGPVAAFS